MNDTDIEDGEPLLTLRIENDDVYGDCPNDWGGWYYVDFDKSKRFSEDEKHYIHDESTRTNPIPANIGIKARLKAGTAFWVKLQQHSDSQWSLWTPEWGLSPAGIVIWKGSRKDLPGTFYQRKESASHFVENIWTKWAEGHVYRWRLEDENGDDIEDFGRDSEYDETQMFAEIRKALATFPKETVARLAVEGDAAWLTNYYDHEPKTPVQERLEELRTILRSESISYGELHELQSLADQIDPGDVELLEAAGVPEFPPDTDGDDVTPTETTATHGSPDPTNPHGGT